jgi:hypothetical protein
MLVLGPVCVACGLAAELVLRDRPPSSGEPAAFARPERTKSRPHAREIDQILASGGQQQVSEVLEFMNRMVSSAECRSFARNLIADPDNQNSRTLWSLVLARWSVVDPEGMIEFVEAEKNSGRGCNLEPLAWFAWAASDPTHLATLAPQLQNSHGREVLKGLAAVDPGLALDVAFKMPEANGAVNTAIRASGKHDPERIRSLMPRAVYDGMRGPMQDHLRDSLLKEDPRKAVDLARSHGRSWSDPVAQTLGLAARNDPGEAVRILEELPSSRRRAISTVAVARSWAMNDPDGALAWIREQSPGEVRNTSLVGVASVIGGNDPAGGLALLEEVGWRKVGAFYAIGSVGKGGGLNNQVQEHETVQTLGVAKNLLRGLEAMDPDQARDYVTSIVPPEHREQMMKVLGEDKP